MIKDELTLWPKGLFFFYLAAYISIKHLTDAASHLIFRGPGMAIGQEFLVKKIKKKKKNEAGWDTLHKKAWWTSIYIWKKSKYTKKKKHMNGKSEFLKKKKKRLVRAIYI